MANRNRVIYQSEALYVGPTDDTGGNDGCRIAHPASSINQLQRVQSANYSFTIDRQDVNQFGELAAIDRVILSAPTVALDFSYLVANMVNEESLGFHVSNGSWVSSISGILNKTADEKCYFIRTTAEGSDALGVANNASDQGVIGIGNGYITSYTTEASVGNFPTASVNVEALNMRVYSGASAATGSNIPAVIPETGAADTTNVFHLPDVVSHVASTTGGLTDAGATGQDVTSVLRPGDISFGLATVDSAGAETAWTGDVGAAIEDPDAAVGSAKIQSYNISFDLGRTPLEKLGSKFAFAREIDFPVTITMSIEAQVSDLAAGGLASLVADDKNYNLYVYLEDPRSGAAFDVYNAVYHIKRAKLDSQEFSSAIGDNKSVTLNFSAQVGGPNQNSVGFFMSGVI
jgi:hypothetical protein